MIDKYLLTQKFKRIEQFLREMETADGPATFDEFSSNTVFKRFIERGIFWVLSFERNSLPGEKGMSFQSISFKLYRRTTAYSRDEFNPRLFIPGRTSRI